MIYAILLGEYLRRPEMWLGDRLEVHEMTVHRFFIAFLGVERNGLDGTSSVNLIFYTLCFRLPLLELTLASHVLTYSTVTCLHVSN